MKKTAYFIIGLSLLFSLLHAQDFTYFEKEKNIWLQVYSNQLKAQALDSDIKALERSIKEAGTKKKIELNQLLQLQTSKKKILDELPQSFDTMLEKITVESVKDINLIEYLFTSQKGKFNIQTQRLKILKQEFDDAVAFLTKELATTESQENRDFFKEYQLKKALDFFENASGLLENKEEVLKRTKQSYMSELEAYKQTQLPIHIIKIAILFLIFLLFNLLKYFITKKIDNEDRLFRIKRVLNITFFLLILLMLIIFNISNIVYAATLIGVIAAAITISMKEYLQSMATWFHLSFGNSLKVGDRILIQTNNNQIIGEVINISLFQVTLYESINNTTALDLKRSGRTVFIPNNFFVTNYVYNYTHDRMKTIYDLLEFKIPFTCDTKRVEDLVTEVTLEATEKYMEIALKQFSSLRKRYDMRSREFRPRIHFIPDTKSSCFILYIWYAAPYHQIMELKSQLSQKIVKKLQENEIEFCSN
ncbi:MscS Mechanosensitive ion channel [Sulfurimonas denitrificans DSM 1251]|uniref:MscS Mechanosensitive ion channel n=1 Tax=Sulfurimonas denitrificans (strain ATCC 33889 / DSM 1251) TaxID=326298 RepID=Q30PW4_SULDN|nr:mechanosensitive ion channel domain-containing protein [Sulfurimonas denitrificans]ABB44967.1 MscS Mechanosensitive ion channel [Sulfurimonas denitrificans DSM 1251]MDD3442631.1 mechanosensitive ion channel [Sulfurimonas denitrificans]